MSFSAKIIKTRIPAGRQVVGLEYGSHVFGPGWGGYYVRIHGSNEWVLARETPAQDEVFDSDREVVEAIGDEIGFEAIFPRDAWTDPEPMSLGGDSEWHAYCGLVGVIWGVSPDDEYGVATSWAVVVHVADGVEIDGPTGHFDGLDALADAVSFAESTDVAGVHQGRKDGGSQ